MDGYKFKSREDAMDLIAWMHSRNDYRRACGMESDPEADTASAAALHYLAQLDGVMYEPIRVPFIVI